jgi:hypothetical protein
MEEACPDSVRARIMQPPKLTPVHVVETGSKAIRLHLCGSDLCNNLGAKLAHRRKIGTRRRYSAVDLYGHRGEHD